MVHDTAANKALLEQIVAAFNTGDLSQVDVIFAPGYVDHQKPADWTIDGPEEFKQIVTNALAATRSLRVDVQDVLAENDRVAARLLWRGVDHEGVKLHRETLEILRIQNGQVVEHWGAESWRSAL